MRQFAWLFGVAACAGLLSGCVDRRYVITSDPPGAVVYVNNQPIGATPVDAHFTYYGNYHFTLVKDGYATQQVDQDIPAPWYQWFGVDFFSENVWPHREVDVRRFNYKMEPLPQPSVNDLLSKSATLRTRGQALPTPAPSATAAGGLEQ